RPPPSTRSSSPIPVWVRRWSSSATSPRSTGTGASTPPVQPPRPRTDGTAADRGASTISLIVFHALHSPHWPCHLPDSAPQSLHTNAVVAFLAVFAMPRSVADPGPIARDAIAPRAIGPDARAAGPLESAWAPSEHLD